VHEEIEAYLNRQRYELSKQIAIETRIMIVTDTFLEDIGLDEFLPESYETSGGMGEIVVGPANSAEILAVLEYIPLDERELPPLEDPKHTFQTLDDLKAEFLIRASQAHSNVKTLTAPKAMVLNGEAALMQIHSQLTYIDIEDEQKFLQKGITLDILPTMQDDDNEVLLKGYIQLNDVLEDRPVEHDGKTYTIPTVQVVNIPIHAVVQDEETLLIGGPELTVTKESVTNPGMGKIPILGRYLSNRSIVIDKQRLLVLIKPTIMIPEEEPEDAIGVLAPRPNGGGMMGGMGVGGGMMMGGYGAAAAGDMESVEER
jgi:type II secretory pathway component GspD/PulD (secretin)